MSYVIQANALTIDYDYKPRGGCEQFFYAHDPEVIIYGAAETGKTLAACWKAHLICSMYPGAQGAILRKVERSLYGSVLQTFGRVIERAPVKVFGGERPDQYIYANGSRVWLGGMDNADKVLSSERDFIYVNQAEEFSASDWEMLLTRTTGRSAVIPYHLVQVFGDCNPGRSKHWILERANKGSLKLIQSHHTDNPTLYTDDGVLTDQGKRTFEVLDSLTGVRYKRLRLGEWATAEGTVYDFDSDVHVTQRDTALSQRWYLAVDEGYTNPAVVLLVGADSDNRWHVHREFYERGKLQSAIVQQIKQWYKEFSCELTAVDSSAAGLIADCRDAGINAIPAKGRVLDGIQAVQDRLRVSDDGQPRLTVDPSCVNTINEFESYVWKPEKDEPVKDNDHAMDALRYLDDATQFGVGVYV